MVRRNIIFSGMKIAATILLFVISFLTIQPLFQSAPKKIAMSCCSQKACKKKMPAQNKKGGCEGMACNPFVGCPYYSLFLFSGPQVSFLSSAVKEKISVSNDNRIIQDISEFWHPPNA